MILTKKIFSILVVFSMIGSFFGFSMQVNAEESITPGDLIKGSMSTVYYYAEDGNRYNFPNEKTYFTWYDNFDDVKIIDDSTLATLQLVGNVTYRPGSRMLKVQSDPKVYIIERNGTLRWVTSESIASDIYGSNWNQYIDDISVAFFPYYTTGDQIDNSDDHARNEEYSFSSNIDIDKGLIAGPYDVPSECTLTNLGSSVSSEDSFNISWNSVTNAVRYKIERDTNNDFSNPTKVHSGSAISISEYLTPEETSTYLYRVKAINPAGSGDWSSIQSITVFNETIPESPVLINPGDSANSGETFDLSLNVTPSENTTYTIEQGIEPGFQAYVTEIYNGDALTYSHAITVSSDKTYYFRAKASNSAGSSDWSNIQSIEITFN